MPVPAKLSPLATFLGLELGHEQVRAVVVDEHLTVLGYETVDFDVDLAEFGTRGGSIPAEGDVYTAPVEMWIKGLDTVLDKVRTRFDMSRVKAIGGCAQQSALVYLKNPAALSTLTSAASAQQALHSLLLTNNGMLSIAQTTVTQDASAIYQAAAFEATLGGPEAMAERVGMAAHLSMPAVHLIKTRETQPEAWKSSKKVLWASSFVASILLGKCAMLSVGEAAASGMWNAKIGGWDDGVLDLVSGGTGSSPRSAGAKKVKEMLGSVEMFGGKNMGNVASYFVERYGFDKDTFIVPFTSDNLASFLSVCPNQNEAVLSFGAHDAFMIPAPKYLPSNLYNLYPHPAQEPSEPKKYVAMLSTRNADNARASVRDTYTKSWSAFDRLASIVPPGGSIGLDDKLFNFWILQPENAPFTPRTQGIFRFEGGAQTQEFRDLRANPRCLLESQILAFRARYARMMASPLFAGNNANLKRGPSKPMSLMANRMGFRFDPYDSANLPTKIITAGSAAAQFPSVVSLIGDVFHSSVFVPASTSSAFSIPSNRSEASPGGMSPNPTIPGGAAAGATPSSLVAVLGGAYAARWAWRRTVRPEDKFESFEAEVRDLLKQKWQYNASTSSMPKTPNTAGLLGYSPVANPAASASAVLAHPHPPAKRSNLSATAVVHEEDEEEEEDQVLGRYPSSQTPVIVSDPYQQFVGLGIGGLTAASYGSFGVSPEGAMPHITRARTPTTSSTASTNLSSAPSALSIGTAPGLYGASPSLSSPATTASPSGTTFGSAIHTLPTDDKDAQAGLVKVSDGDYDAFVMYASIVPEFCRLEGMLIKNLL